jgi:hypothetical protein
MNLHTITTLAAVLGLSIVVFCLVQAEVNYRRVTRHLERKRATDDDASAPEDGP